MESERPCCYTECCDAETSWDQYGMRIKWTEPAVSGKSKVAMLDPLVIKLCLECKKPIPLRNVSAWAWTHIFHQDNTEGIFREIKLAYNPKSRKWDDWGVTTYEFFAIIYPTHSAYFRLTYNVKYEKLMIWANVFQADHILTVLAPRDVNIWTKSPRYSQITRNIYLGNYLAVILAEENGFDAVLNLHVETDERAGEDPKIKVFKSSEVKSGSGNEIDGQQLKELVQWLMEVNMNCYRILVGDHEGLGRAGSVIVAYIFANNRNLTFDEAYNYVKTRTYVFCHKGLKETLYQLYPRD
ncbi:unnamed protein product [Candidula unifasciata]|uniref:Dual specificity phosphatase catalytic domain-containing protein n=1 Tax=Candidula unifasciata TaxID=100452 RepID=A0A8S3YV34_9EUPU|nr:unnamed protein product [Candidula unifasciata]